MSVSVLLAVKVLPSAIVNVEPVAGAVMATLLMLVAAFSGFEHMHRVYQHAIAQQYRFFSYGDAMLLSRMVSKLPAC